MFSQLLPSELGKSFVVSFVFDEETDWGWGFGIDNFKACGTSGIASDLNNVIVGITDSVKVYPNPALDVVYIDTSWTLLKRSFITVIIALFNYLIDNIL